MTILTSSTDSDTRALVEAQWLFTESDLSSTPTVLAGLMSVEEERKARTRGVSLLFRVGDRLQLMSHVVTSAAIFFHRFFMRRAMRPIGHRDAIGAQPTFVPQDVALASLYLATKTEESYRKLSDLVSVGLEMEPMVTETLEQPTEQSLRASILRHEELLLPTLCFDLIVPHPQKDLILAANKMAIDKPLLRIAYAHIHDAFRDPICMFFEAPVLAAGALALACEDLGIPVPGEGVKEGEGSTSTAVEDGEARPPTLLEAFQVDQEEVDAVVKDLKAVREVLFADPKLYLSSGRFAPASAAAKAATAAQAQRSGIDSGLATPHHQYRHRETSQPTASSMGNTPILRGISAADMGVSPLPPPPMERVAASVAAHGSSRPDLARPPSRHGSVRSEGMAFGAGPSSNPAGGAQKPKQASYVPLSPVLAPPEEEQAPGPATVESSTAARPNPPSQPAPASRPAKYVPLSPPNYSDPVPMDTDSSPALRPSQSQQPRPPTSVMASAAATPVQRPRVAEQEAAQKVGREQEKSERAAVSAIPADHEEGEIDE